MFIAESLPAQVNLTSHNSSKRFQVKTIIRRLVESEDLYNLIMEKAGEKPEAESSAKVEPRITRKVAK